MAFPEPAISDFAAVQRQPIEKGLRPWAVQAMNVSACNERPVKAPGRKTIFGSDHAMSFDDARRSGRKTTAAKEYFREDIEKLPLPSAVVAQDNA